MISNCSPQLSYKFAFLPAKYKDTSFPTHFTVGKCKKKPLFDITDFLKCYLTVALFYISFFFEWGWVYFHIFRLIAFPFLWTLLYFAMFLLGCSSFSIDMVGILHTAVMYWMFPQHHFQNNKMSTLSYFKFSDVFGTISRFLFYAFEISVLL